MPGFPSSQPLLGASAAEYLFCPQLPEPSPGAPWDPGTAEHVPGNPWLRGPQGPTDSHHLTLFKLLLFLNYPSNACSLQEN